MIERDTIAAISTPAGTGAIAVVRISGPLSYGILEQIFSSSSKEFKNIDLRKPGSHKAIHGYIYDPRKAIFIDEVVCICYRAPNTYTGDDLIEINCHGSPLITEEVLALLLSTGARLALPGEFTKRAFLSGKMDLTQAESVLDLIQAKTGRQSRLALSALEGHIGRKIAEIRGELLALLSKLVAGIDFPEEVGELPRDDIEAVVESAIDRLNKLARTTRSGRFLREGLKLSLVGRPNAGKSSLLNRLLCFDRAIVSDTPGTTRDSIEEMLDLNGVPVTLIDTAGIRVTDDSIEIAGIERTTRAIKESDLTLFIVDSTIPFEEPEEKILELIDKAPYILVWNKIDLSKRDPEQINGSQTVATVPISAVTGEGLDRLSAEIEKWALTGNTLVETGGSLNQRQGELCRKATISLEEVLKASALGMLEDCIATDLKSAIHDLSEACGDEVTEEVITEVFSRFCIGK